ncbi:MAG: hypothetical protein QOJ65_262 [Fimbriimonadaceae bacterium]|jgi:hypothetical protein|nr:hypothetical protein [Fimbriimonadaceae bacterium]
MNRNYAKPAAFLAAGFIATLAAVTVQKAYATTTVANASKTTLSSPGGGNSVTIGVAAINSPVMLAATQVDVGFRGTSSATILSATASPALMQWVALSAGPSTAVVSSFTTGAGVTMFNTGWNATTQLATSGVTSFHIHNSSTSTKTVVVMQVW